MGDGRRPGARSRAGPVRLLVVDDLVPDGRLGFGFPRADLLLRALGALGHGITVLGLRQDRTPAPEVLRALAGRGIVVAGLGRGGFPAYLRRHHRSFDAVWVSRLRNLRHTVETVRATAPRLVLIYDAEAVLAPREILRRARLGEPPGPREAQRMLREETALMARADLVVAVSGPDRRLIAGAGVGPVFLLGHPQPGPPTRGGFARRRDVLLVHGNLNGSTATPEWLRYYVGEILPRVHARLDDAAFHIAGYRSDLYTLPAVEAPLAARIVRHGFVERLRRLHGACRVLAVPTLVAGGISEKLVEALALGVPAVVSPLVASQLDLDDGQEAVLIGRDAEEFAAQLIRCYTDPALWARLRRNGLRWARDHRARFRRELARLDRAIRDRLADPAAGAPARAGSQRAGRRRAAPDAGGRVPAGGTA